MWPWPWADVGGGGIFFDRCRIQSTVIREPRWVWGVAVAVGRRGWGGIFFGRCHIQSTVILGPTWVWGGIFFGRCRIQSTVILGLTWVWGVGVAVGRRGWGWYILWPLSYSVDRNSRADVDVGRGRYMRLNDPPTSGCFMKNPLEKKTN